MIDPGQELAVAQPLGQAVGLLAQAAMGPVQRDDPAAGRGRDDCKLAEFRREADRLGVVVEPPSVNRGGREFDVAEDRIIYALAALRGVGGQAVDAIVKARGDKPFADLSDFASRIDPRAVNKRTLESLAASGAFDGLEPRRARAFASVESLLAHAQRVGADAASGQSELFGGIDFVIDVTAGVVGT